MRTLLQPLMFVEESVLEGLHAVGIAWGLAIVGLTLLVRLALLPLAIRHVRARRLGVRPRGALAGVVLQILVVISLALLLRSDAAAGTFGDAGWWFIADLSEPAGGAALAALLGSWIALQLVSLRLAARVSRRRVAIALLAPVPLLFAATQLPAGILVYLLVSSAFGLAQKVALRAPAPALAAT
jgi:YidC/Oxa1 family membrane protein insertase